MPTGPREKLVRLLDYVEQVIRLDERVVFQLSDYRLPDGTSFCITGPEHRDLPGVRFGARDDEGPVWLEVARLAREEPPPPPAEIADWIVLSPDPASRREAARGGWSPQTPPSATSPSQMARCGRRT